MPVNTFLRSFLQVVHYRVALFSGQNQLCPAEGYRFCSRKSQVLILSEMHRAVQKMCFLIVIFF